MFVLPKTLDANVNNPTTFSVGGRRRKRRRTIRKIKRKRKRTRTNKKRKSL